MAITDNLFSIEEKKVLFRASLVSADPFVLRQFPQSDRPPLPFAAPSIAPPRPTRPGKEAESLPQIR